jgi:hypothetical protein
MPFDDHPLSGARTMDLPLSERQCRILARSTVNAVPMQPAATGGSEPADSLAALLHALSEPLTAIRSYSAAAQAHLAQQPAGPERAKLDLALQEIAYQSTRVVDVIRLLRELGVTMREGG